MRTLSFHYPLNHLQFDTENHNENVGNEVSVLGRGQLQLRLITLMRITLLGIVHELVLRVTSISSSEEIYSNIANSRAMHNVPSCVVKMPPIDITDK